MYSATSQLHTAPSGADTSMYTNGVTTRPRSHAHDYANERDLLPARVQPVYESVAVPVESEHGHGQNECQSRSESHSYSRPHHRPSHFTFSSRDITRSIQRAAEREAARAERARASERLRAERAALQAWEERETARERELEQRRLEQKRLAMQAEQERQRAQRMLNQQREQALAADTARRVGFMLQQQSRQERIMSREIDSKKATAHGDGKHGSAPRGSPPSTASTSSSSDSSDSSVTVPVRRRSASHRPPRHFRFTPHDIQKSYSKPSQRPRIGHWTTFPRSSTGIYPPERLRAWINMQVRAQSAPTSPLDKKQKQQKEEKSTHQHAMTARLPQTNGTTHVNGSQGVTGNSTFAPKPPLPPNGSETGMTANTSMRHTAAAAGVRPGHARSRTLLTYTQLQEKAMKQSALSDEAGDWAKRAENGYNLPNLSEKDTAIRRDASRPTHTRHLSTLDHALVNLMSQHNIHGSKLHSSVNVASSNIEAGRAQSGLPSSVEMVPRRIQRHELPVPLGAPIVSAPHSPNRAGSNSLLQQTSAKRTTKSAHVSPAPRGRSLLSAQRTVATLPHPIDSSARAIPSHPSSGASSSRPGLVGSRSRTLPAAMHGHESGSGMKLHSSPTMHRRSIHDQMQVQAWANQIKQEDEVDMRKYQKERAEAEKPEWMQLTDRQKKLQAADGQTSMYKDSMMQNVASAHARL